MKRIFFLYILSLSLPGCSQSSGDSSKTPSVNSSIVDHSGVQKYIESHKIIVKKKPFTEGYRIQIYNGNNKDDAKNVKTEFYSKFPGMRCYLTYQQPYYKVRVGDYEDQASAKLDIKKMARFYPSSFLVPDQIRRTGEEKDSKDAKAGSNAN